VKHSRALLADAHIDMLASVHGLLHELFETVVMVADEPSLMETVETLRPELVVVDLSLPGTGEANIARRLKVRDPTLCIVVLSVHDDPTIASQVRKAGAAGFVLKRTAATELGPAVEEVLRGGAYVSPCISETEAPGHGQRMGVGHANSNPKSRDRKG
jgi:DNA-binding NarL/FixJ family response regulator